MIKIIKAKKDEYGLTFINESENEVSLIRQPLLFYKITKKDGEPDMEITPVCNPGDIFPPDFIRRYDGSYVTSSGDTWGFTLESIMIGLGYVPTEPEKKTPETLMELDTYLWTKRFAQKDNVN